MNNKNMLAEETILITGGTGSWGYELIEQLLKKTQAKKIRVYSRGEMRQYDMEKHFNNPRLQFIIGDVRDKERLFFACQNVDSVIHMAALKHVPVCETNPDEAIKTNINGTQNLIWAAIESRVKKVVDISTDKAVDPLNVYGVTKACAEKLCVSANLYTNDTKFACVRAGNVLGTNGSIIPLFKKQIQESKDLTITHADMTRFSMQVEEAIKLIFVALSTMQGGEIFVPKVPSCPVLTLAEVMNESLAGGKSQIKYIGIRPGEKLHETLISKNEASRTHDFGDYFIVLPYIPMPHLKTAHGKLQTHPALETEYTSENAQTLSHQELLSLLRQGGWI